MDCKGIKSSLPKTCANRCVDNFILWIFIVIPSLVFNGCGPSSAEIKQEFEKAQTIDTREAYRHFLTLWHSSDFWSLSCPEYSQYEEFCNITTKRMRDKISLRGNRVELWPVTQEIIYYGPQNNLDESYHFLREGIYIRMISYTIRNKIEEGLIARGFSVAWGDPIKSNELRGWQTLPQISKRVISRRDAGFDAVIAVDFKIIKASEYPDGTLPPSVPIDVSFFCNVFDTNDGSTILFVGRNIGRPRQKTGEVYKGTIYQVAESEDSFLTRAFNTFIESVPE